MRFPNRSLSVILMAGAALAACATPQPLYSNRLAPPKLAQSPGSPSTGRYKVGEPYQVAGIWYVPKEQPNYDETGMASWYGDAFNLQPTANGEIFDMSAISAAHPTLPLPSMVEVTNLDNGKTLQVRVNDRGPFVGGRVIDLSHAAAQQLGYDRQGLARVRVRYVGPASLENNTPDLRVASNGVGNDLPELSGPIATSLPVAVASATLPPVSAQTASLATSSGYRVQAGAFSDRDNARRVASNLSQAGEAIIEPIDRNGITLYRVTLGASTDEGQAFALRDQVAALGYSDARVLQPF